MDFLFYAILPIIALLYAAVGHGGASGYLALMALFEVAPEELRPTALLLNLFVAGISFIHFYHIGVFKFKLFLAFAITSIPLAFFGGTLNLDAGIYKVMLGVFLLLAVGKMAGLFDRFLKKTDYDASAQNPNYTITATVGGGIGLFSGLIGIGGGIILSPIIILMRWGNAKEAAAISALFIWVNSLSGLMGQFTNEITFYKDVWILVLLASIGGLAGAYIGSRKMNNKKLRYLLSIVLFLAAIKLIFTV